jgi:acetate kinase
VLIYLMRERHITPDALERMLYKESGLRGLSSLSSDMRDLLATEDPRARLAVAYFIHHACRHVAALASTMEGIDAIVFTAGIGEHAPTIRKQICGRLAWLGVTLDDAGNEAGGPRITSDASPVSAWVIPTDEESQIADDTVAALRAAEKGGMR